MSLVDLKLLIFAQIGIDIIIVVLFVLFFRKFHGEQGKTRPVPEAETAASLLAEADQLAVALNRQLQEKKQLIQRLNEQLDEKTMSLKVLLKRSEYLLAEQRQDNSPNALTAGRDQAGEKVVRMAQQGCDIESIANRLAIPREKVKLLLDLRRSEIASDKRKGEA